MLDFTLIVTCIRSHTLLIKKSSVYSCPSTHCCGTEDSKDQNQASWARHIKVDVRTLKSWLVLAVAADLLGFLRTLNVQSQRSSLRVLDIETHLELCFKDLQGYMRPGTGKLAAGLKQLFQPYSAPGQAATRHTYFWQVSSRLSESVRGFSGGGILHYRLPLLLSFVCIARPPWWKNFAARCM